MGRSDFLPSDNTELDGTILPSMAWYFKLSPKGVSIVLEYVRCAMDIKSYLYIPRLET